jgi:hypothetical protein
LNLSLQENYQISQPGPASPTQIPPSRKESHLTLSINKPAQNPAFPTAFFLDIL